MAQSWVDKRCQFALPGETVRLHGSEIGNVEFRATRAGEPVSVDWEVVPRGRLEELSYGSFDGLGFSGETVERSLPFGKYLIRARLGGALVSREVVVVEQESTIVLAEVSPEARVVELSIVGSISGPRPLVIQEGRLRVRLTGISGAGELWVTHASPRNAWKAYLTIKTRPEIELLLPLGSGSVSIRGARSEVLTTDFKMDSPGGASCELDCDGQELIPVLVSVEGAWYFEGRIQTEMELAGAPTVLTMFPLNIYEVRPPTSLTIASFTAMKTVLVVRGVMYTDVGTVVNVDLTWPLGTVGSESRLAIRILLKDGVPEVDVRSE